MIVTIDGPAGAGKSSAARLIAKHLGFSFLDTGAMYRAVTWAVLNEQIDPKNTREVNPFLKQITLQIEGNRISVNGRDVTEEIRSTSINRNIGPVADNPAVRDMLVQLQRHLAQTGNFVCEGRDQGTVAFPQAECKIFLNASSSHRARRRVMELEAKQVPADYTVILNEQNRRDREDEARPVGQLRKADDAIEIVTDDLTLDQVVAKIVEIVLHRKKSLEAN